MALHKGRPSGNKPDSRGTGIPSDFKPSDLNRDRNFADKYLRDDDELGENVRFQHRNRNTHKKNGTNAGGYRY